MFEVELLHIIRALNLLSNWTVVLKTEYYLPTKS
jgi:hypothetical protein